MAAVREAETVLQPVDTNRAVAARLTVRTDFISFISACFFWLVLESLMFRKKESHGEPEPPIRPAAGTIGVVASADLKLDWQLTDLQELAYHEVERHRPLVERPIVRGLGVQTESRIGLGREGNEGLQERGIYRAVSPAGVGPDLICQHAIRPTVLLT